MEIISKQKEMNLFNFDLDTLSLKDKRYISKPNQIEYFKEIESNSHL